MNRAREQYLEVADQIGRGLCRDAIWDQDRCTWLGWVHEVHQTGSAKMFRAMQGDLYAGTAGVALLLSELYQFTQDPLQLRCIDGALNQALSLAEKRASNQTASFYSGLTGLAFVLTKVARTTGRDSLLERARQILLPLRDEVLDPIAIDVVSGSAGAIPALLYLAKALDCPELLELADMHGQHLLARATVGGQDLASTISWQTSRNEDEPHLNGYSHGSSGIATALLELYQVTQGPDYLQAVHAALRFERAQLNREVGNWPDHRVPPSGRKDNGMSFSLAWCHGAPGLGLARLRQSQILSTNSEVKEDLEIAISTTERALAQAWKLGRRNFSLCHGDAGNADLLIQASHDLRRPNLMEVAEQVGQNGIQHILKEGRPWPCGNSGVGETPSLMLGTAGISHFYLRLYDAVKVPSILITTPNQV